MFVRVDLEVVKKDNQRPGQPPIRMTDALRVMWSC